MGADVPNNGGYFRPITVIAPEGTIVNPLAPGPVAARGLTGFRIANVVFGALAQAAPRLGPRMRNRRRYRRKHRRLRACRARWKNGIARLCVP